MDPSDPDSDPDRVGSTLPTLADLDWPRRTARLVLRPLVPDDVDALWAYRSDPSTLRWTGRSARSRDDLAAQFFTDEHLATTLVIELDGVPVGDLMVRRGDGWAQHDVREAGVGTVVTLGWTLSPAHHGRGIMTEAVTELLVISFDGLGARRVVAECFEANTASWRLMERLGMRREAHHVAASYQRDLGWVDDLVYALLAEEWRKRPTGQGGVPTAARPGREHDGREPRHLSQGEHP